MTRENSSASNNLELNEGDNFIFGVDVSASMGTQDCPAGMSRIEYLKEKVTQFATQASQYDTDGIDVLTFGERVTHYKNVSAENAANVISGLKANESATDTAELIRRAWQLHKNGGYEQTVLFVATDGEPSSRSAVKRAIIDVTNQVTDPREFNISFLTVGEVNQSLRDFLTRLDDELTAEGAKHDIVDVKALSDVDFMSAFSGAIND